MNRIPVAEADLLRDLRFDLPALRGRVSLLRTAGWSLAEIALPLSVHRSTVQAWADPLLPRTYPAHHPQPPASPSFLAARARAHTHPLPGRRARALPVDVPPDDARRLADLAPDAARNRAGTPTTSRFHRASLEFNELLRKHADRGVPTQRLADLSGVTYRAINRRLAATRDTP